MNIEYKDEIYRMYKFPSSVDKPFQPFSPFTSSPRHKISKQDLPYGKGPRVKASRKVVHDKGVGTTRQQHHLSESRIREAMIRPYAFERICPD